ncbi:MAG: SGNH/GDSL hydrolase family protein [candidate division KSB1 bacterium]|nr:SGNH/GDSL hydrolase family protein [candidate division KSB1 bacterium]
MLLGDSITEGKFALDNRGFRKYLYDKLNANNFDIDFVGDSGISPYEGYFEGGMKINDFYPAHSTPTAKGRMDATGQMNKHQPTLVSIHLGTNDLHSETGTPITPYIENNEFAVTQSGEMAYLVNYLLNWHNGNYGEHLEKILVSMIIPIRDWDTVSVAYNNEIAKMVMDFQNGVITGKPEPVYLCNQFSFFREFKLYGNRLMEDGLHPNTRGHNRMGEVYYERFAELLSGKSRWFTDKTFQAGIQGKDHHYEHQGVAVADITNDNRPDIYITRTNFAYPG